MEFEEKVVMVTGAGRGIGKATSLMFLSKGWKVIATDQYFPEFNDRESLALFSADPECRSRLSCFRMDVTSGEDVGKTSEHLMDRKITIDLIINNAGTDAYMLFSEAPVSEFLKVFETNVFGAYRVNQTFFPLIRKPGGRIIHIGSESLNLTMPFMPYPLSKKLLEGYAKALRGELKFLGIDVVVLRPGAVDTELLKTVSRLPVNMPRGNESDPRQKAFGKFAMQASKEIGKVISPEETAGFIYRIGTIPKPGAVYRINNMFQLRLMAIMPFSMIEMFVHRRLKTKNNEKQ